MRKTILFIVVMNVNAVENKQALKVSFVLYMRIMV
jgi:hypothetical protein